MGDQKKYSAVGISGQDFAALAVLAIFFTVFFRRALFGGQFLLAGDPLTYSYPLRSIAWELIRQGELPLWTPHILSGYPLLSMAVVAIGYPLTWGYLFLPGYWAEQIYVLAPYLLAPIFTYFYARQIGRSPLASLLAGLSFGYGGLMLSPLGSYGYLPNAVMWTPLLLIAAERARTRRFASCLLLATFAYAMSVLTGIGQGFVYAGALALAYALFLSLSGRDWKPIAVIGGAILLAAGVAAFQILETLRAASSSVRVKLTYEYFSEGSFTSGLAWRSWLDPIHHLGDVTTYTPLLAVILGVAAVIFAVKDGRGDWRVWFWLVIAVVSVVLILGSNTPLYQLVYKIPFINRFRVPSRHSFEWTLAVSILAADGWDALATRRRKLRFEWLNLVLSVAAVLAGAIVAFRLLQGMKIEGGAPWLIFGDLNGEYLVWKALLTLLILISVRLAWPIKPSRGKAILLGSAIVLACFIEPYLGFKRWIEPFSVTKDRFEYSSPVTRFLRQFPPEQNRFFPQISLFAENHAKNPKLDLLNWAGLAGLQSAAGYEPLIFDRYARALSSEKWDEVSRGPFLQPDRALFENRSRVLDLLNVTHAATYADLAAEPGAVIEKDGLQLPAADAAVDLRADAPAILNFNGEECDGLAVVSALANSGGIADGVTVAKVSVYTTDGRAITRELRAGDDAAEWAHERADVRSSIKHRLAPVFDSQPGDERNSFPSYRYLARVGFGERIRAQRIELIKTIPEISVVIWKTSLIDSQTGRSGAPLNLDRSRWEVLQQQDGVILLHNRRALPRAWLVTAAEAVDQTEAWAMIRGQSNRSFDPLRTALLEIEPGKMPALSGQPLSSDSSAKIVKYAANSLAIETNSDQQAVLVISEMNYPGWIATVDGIKTAIHQTDFLLRGVIVPAGRHQVEMSYRAPGARNGAIISALTLLLIGGIGAHSLQKERRETTEQTEITEQTE